MPHHVKDTTGELEAHPTRLNRYKSYMLGEVYKLNSKVSMYASFQHWLEEQTDYPSIDLTVLDAKRAPFEKAVLETTDHGLEGGATVSQVREYSQPRVSPLQGRASQILRKLEQVEAISIDTSKLEPQVRQSLGLTEDTTYITWGVSILVVQLIQVFVDVAFCNG